MFEYEWCGIGIRSSIELPLQAMGGAAEGPITIRAGAVPLAPLDVDPQARFFHGRPGRLLLNVPQVARYLIERGERVTFDACRGAEPPDIQTFLLGSALGAACHQRGLLPLHASAIRVGNASVAFGGSSGAGKSTIAAFLTTRGHPLVADDQTVVTIGEDGGAEVRTGPRRVKLWKDGLDALSADTATLPRVRGRLDKYHLPLSLASGPARLPLRRLYLLADGGETWELEPLNGFAAVEAVQQTVYRREFIGPLGLTESSFRLAARLAASVEVAVLRRPRRLEYMPHLLDALEAVWAKNTA